MEALTCGNTEIAPQNLRITMNKLARVQKSGKQTGYAEEFKVLPFVFFTVQGSFREWGWLKGERTRLPPVWSGFYSCQMPQVG